MTSSLDMGHAVFVVATGLLLVLAGVLNWDWFVEDRRGRFIVDSLGRGGARMFYILLGLALLAFGTTGWLE